MSIRHRLLHHSKNLSFFWFEEDIIADLENYLDGPSSTRPVRLEVRRATGRRRMEASSVAEAVQKLIEEVSVDDAKWEMLRIHSS